MNEFDRLSVLAAIEECEKRIQTDRESMLLDLTLFVDLMDSTEVPLYLQSTVKDVVQQLRKLKAIWQAAWGLEVEELFLDGRYSMPEDSK